MPNAKQKRQTSGLKATLEDQSNPITRLTIQSEGREETHRLVHQLQNAGYLFERILTDSEMQQQAEDMAERMIMHNLGRRFNKALQAKGLLKLAAKYIYFKT